MKVFKVHLFEELSLSQLTKSIRDTLESVYDAKDSNVVVIFGCASTCRAIPEHNSVQLVSAWERALRQLEMSNAIIVFASETDVFGPTLDLMLISDYRILLRSVNIGFALKGDVLVGMSLYRMTNQIGQAHTRRAILMGRTFAAEEARILGMADDISDNVPEGLAGALDAFQSVSSSELALRRRLLLEAHALEYENALGAYLAAHARNRQGVSA